MTAIASVPELEACIGAAGLPVKMKIIDHLDAAARQWIAASPLAFIGVGSKDGPRVSVAGGPRGFATVAADGALTLPQEAIDDLGPVEPGQGAGVLFLAPGVGETLRANGRIRAVTANHLEIAVEECFVHCAKALIRSEFWRGAEPSPPADAEAFVNAARFLALATMDAEGRIDISPKGDPAALLIHLADGRATLAERPGNRLAFGYRNMIEQPRVAALALVPGAAQVATFAGRAHLTTDEGLRSRFVVDGKTPLLATVIEGAAPLLRQSPALARAEPWSDGPPAGIDPAAVFMAHIKLNKARGPTATLLRLAANRKLISSGLEANYKSDLY
ncbi:MAG: pyridoxamine 5'-phosphate oxidase family protein [Caulobacteraceae bacterium]|nr:pyridoxamine 5'-phosphate oxidase family protein [Caulobacteraceae bacterium]